MPPPKDPERYKLWLERNRASKIGKSTSLKNKTYEQIYGIEKARELRLKQSNVKKGKPSPRKGIRIGIERDSAIYIEWRDFVFERDNHRCRRCGKHLVSGRSKQVHHMIPFENILTRFSVTNGILLCQSCHNKEHSEKERIALLLIRLFDFSPDKVIQFLLDKCKNDDLVTETCKQLTEFTKRNTKWKEENIRIGKGEFYD